MKFLLLAVLCTISLAGCNTTYRDGNQHVHVNDGHGDGRFCPPGQAKKGNC